PTGWRWPPGPRPACAASVTWSSSPANSPKPGPGTVTWSVTVPDPGCCSRIKAMGEVLEIHIVSDSTGDTAARVARAATHQFADVDIELVRHARIHSREQLDRALEDAEGRPAAVFYTLVDAGLRE